MKDELQDVFEPRMEAGLLRPADEIEQEGLPPGAVPWSGPVIHAFEEIHRHSRKDPTPSL